MDFAVDIMCCVLFFDRMFNFILIFLWCISSEVSALSFLMSISRAFCRCKAVCFAWAVEPCLSKRLSTLMMRLEASNAGIDAAVLPSSWVLGSALTDKSCLTVYDGNCCIPWVAKERPHKINRHVFFIGLVFCGWLACIIDDVECRWYKFNLIMLGELVPVCGAIEGD